MLALDNAAVSHIALQQQVERLPALGDVEAYADDALDLTFAVAIDATSALNPPNGIVLHDNPVFDAVV